uniref:Diheme cytochrome c peroxidase n=1 Tax=Siphoviridae sp. ctTXt1 TaxID=2825520 RepID=A0A8S5P8Z1_9CAUD|nr:MAG TPA: Diheme cytochrome c peroxidase [Siphoviridae sp. ctTXt1]
MLHLKKCKENLFYQNRLSSLSFIACHTPDTFA